MSSLRRLLLLAAASMLAAASTTHAFTIASDAFGYPVGAALDGQGGGFGWDTGAFVQGTASGSCGSATPITYGHSGATWVTSSSYTGAGQHDRIAAGSLAYPGVATSGNMLVEVDGALHGGNAGLRAFRTILTSAPGLAPYLQGSFLGHGTIYVAFLARIDATTCAGATPCAAPTCDPSNSHDGGIHLFQGFGNLASCSDGPKHPYEHLFLGDQNRSSTWSIARTTGGGPGDWKGLTSLPFDDTTRLYVLRIDFDTDQACAATSANLGACPAVPNNFGTVATNCGGATTGNETVTVYVDPDLTPPLGVPTGGAATIGPASVYDFAFDTIEIGAEGETVDLDEVRVGTRLADVVDDHPYCAGDADCAADPQGRTQCDTTVGVGVCVPAGGTTSTTVGSSTSTTMTSLGPTTSTTVTSPTSTTTSTSAGPTPTSSSTTTSAASPTSTVHSTSSSSTTTLPVPCSAGAPACDDGDRCTVDTCDPATATCVFAAIAGYDGIGCVCDELPEPCAGVATATRALRHAAHACALVARAQRSAAAGPRLRLLRRSARAFAGALRRAARVEGAAPCVSQVAGWLAWAHDECSRLAAGGM